MSAVLGALGGTVMCLVGCVLFLKAGTWGRVGLMALVMSAIVTWLVVAMREPRASPVWRWTLGGLLVVTLALSAVVLRALTT